MKVLIDDCFLCNHLQDREDPNPTCGKSQQFFIDDGLTPCGERSPRVEYVIDTLEDTKYLVNSFDYRGKLKLEIKTWLEAEQPTTSWEYYPDVGQASLFFASEDDLIHFKLMWD